MKPHKKKEKKNMENKEIVNENTETNMKLSPPWVTYYREIAALLGDDPEIGISYDEEENEIKIRVANGRKADALTALLPVERVFGNVAVKTTVIPANIGEMNRLSLFQDAFNGNPAMSFISAVDMPTMGRVGFVVFRNKVVQFFNDDMTDLYGNQSTIYQEIAKDVFGEDKDLHFCTDLESNPGRPITRNQK